jgi:hypothetical protein
MAALALIISIIALVIALLAFTKSGGSIKEMKLKVEELGASTETMRVKIANILDNLEKKVRGEDKKSPGQPGDSGCPHQDTPGCSQQ